MRIINIELPLKSEEIKMFTIRDKLLISGVLYTARDQAHLRLTQLIKEGKPLPFNLADSALFYCGPAPTPPGKVCGAIGPTTSARMDKYTPLLLENGLKVMIGKGERSRVVTEAIHKYNALYLICVGGISALLVQSIVSCETFCWKELGAEAIYRMEVKNFPCYVATI
ncbi:MAG TPA: FumA C-terminus/TtdB family hydratase beta subunit [Candidatus Syntrophosphaera sp.]|jgi:fumarate hydratase subunit beta|nr:FumA C-terminus/TtdB family hydratase beta subunit [Candidatus Syntrophosphaera sp.]HQM79128.1 FumA C-terminus/TtdB family hydratase beta subunit [Candidatus Syntrophosphaera sp.]